MSLSSIELFFCAVRSWWRRYGCSAWRPRPNVRRRRRWVELTCLAILILAVGLLSPQLFAATYRVSSAAEIHARMEVLEPGDVVMMTRGRWRDQTIRFRANGTGDEPIVLRAEEPGSVVLCGDSALRVDGSHVVVQGLLFTDGFLQSRQGHVVRLEGKGHRLTECAVVDYNPPDIDTRYFWISLGGNGHRVDHCHVSGQAHSGVTLVVWLAGDNPGHHRIDHNYFGPRPRGNANGFETIRVGTSGHSMTSAHVVVENNLFERCDGEVEIISNKSCDNVYRFNTFRECSGCLTLRHGNRCRVEGNVILGNGRRGTGGIRVIGEGHTIVNNYIEGTQARAGGALSITAGIPNSKLHEYVQVKDVTVAFNTFVNNKAPAIELDAGYGSRNRSLLPEDLVIDNNILYAVTDGDPLVEGSAGGTIRWRGNIAYGAPVGYDVGGGVRVVDPLMHQKDTALWRPQPVSPVRDAAVGDYPDVVLDIDGQTRLDVKDVGCDEISDGPVVYRVLDRDDAGPGWPVPE